MEFNSIRAGPAALQFDWLRTGLSIDLPVFIFPIQILQTLYQEGEDAESSSLCGYRTSNLPEKGLMKLLFCLDLSLSRSANHQNHICIHNLIVSSSHAVRPTLKHFQNL